MFEDMTYEAILKSALDRVESDVDKRQGSVIYDAIAPACAELAQAYIKMENILENSFADTACREYLELRAAERGIVPYEATKAVARGVFDKEIPLNSRFSIGDVVFIVKEKIKNFEYKMECESAGSIGNKVFGTLIPINYIEKLGSASLTEILIPGRDEEDTESFRERYFQDVFGDSFGGNKADYFNWVKSIEGVGQVRTVRVNNANNNVMVYVIAADNSMPSQVLLDDIKEKLDPVDMSGYGCGIAPIGHSVRVEAAKEYSVNINIEGSFESTAERDEILEAAKSKIRDYFSKLNSEWENTESGIELYSAYIIIEIIGINGVKNISSLMVNGNSYLKVPESSVLKLGTVNFVS
jgi:baseplate J-like protein